MNHLFKKAMDFMGWEGEAEVDDDFTRDAQLEEPEYQVKKGKVVSITTTTQLKVVVRTPETFEEARDIADHLKSKKPVVINLEGVEKDVARRIVDFLSGAVYAVDGNIQKISTGIFLIAPYNVGIMGDFKDELRNKGVFPFNY